MTVRFSSLHDYLAQRPRLMTVRALARLVDVSETYMSQLGKHPDRKTAKPSLDLACRISLATGGAVSPFVLAGYPEPDGAALSTSPPGD
jgi:hypothetical protein